MPTSIVAADRGRTPLHGRQRDSKALRILRPSPPQLSLSLDGLHPEETCISNQEKVALVAFVETRSHELITGRWCLTASDIHDVLEGALTMPVACRDWTEPRVPMVGG